MMATRAMSPGTGWSWLTRAVNLGSKNPKAILSAGALVVVVACIPTLIQLILQYGFGITNQRATVAFTGFSALYSLLVMAPLVAGFLRVIDATETGVPVHATAVFDIYRPGAGAWRIVGLVLLWLALASVVLAAVFAGIVVAYGRPFLSGITAIVAAAQSAGPGAAPVLPQLPDGFGTLLGLLVLLGLFFNGAYAISMGQVVLARRGILTALADGIVGTFKNLLPLLLLLVVIIGLGLILILLVAIVAVLLGFLGGLVHPALVYVLGVPLYIGAMLVLYVVSLGITYFMWRDICGGVPAATEHQLEL